MPKPVFQAPKNGFLQNADRRATQPLNMEMIAVDLLRPHPDNFFAIEDIDELANDIRENGLLHYPVVRPNTDGSGTYIILSGHRRWHAFQLLQKEDASRFSVMPCQVRKAISDEEAEIILLSSNIQSREVSPREKRQAAARLYRLASARREEGSLSIEGRTKDYVAQQLNLSGKTVMRLVRIDEGLIPELLDLYDNGELPSNVAYAAAALSQKKQRELYTFLKDASPMKEPEIQALLQVVSRVGGDKKSLALASAADAPQVSTSNIELVDDSYADAKKELESLSFQRKSNPTDEELARRVRALERQLTHVQEESRENKREAFLRIRCDALQAQLERIARDILKLSDEVEPKMLDGAVKVAEKLIRGLGLEALENISLDE